MVQGTVDSAPNGQVTALRRQGNDPARQAIDILRSEQSEPVARRELAVERHLILVFGLRVVTAFSSLSHVVAEVLQTLAFSACVVRIERFTLASHEFLEHDAIDGISTVGFPLGLFDPAVAVEMLRPRFDAHAVLALGAGSVLPF